MNVIHYAQSNFDTIVPMDLDVKIKAVMVGAVFLIVSHVLLELNDYQGIN